MIMSFREEQCGKYVLYVCTSPEVLHKCGYYKFQHDFRQNLVLKGMFGKVYLYPGNCFRTH